MAEYLLRKRFGRDSRWEIGSAGLAAIPGLTASPAAVEVMREIGVDLLPHRSRPLARDAIDAAALLVVMTAGHREQVRAKAPRSLEKTFLLRSFESADGKGDVQDPIGLSVEAYRGVRDQIDAALPGLMEFMRSLQLG
jgi:protein-tyrosine phosphatase